MAERGYCAGGPHLHFHSHTTNADDETILNLMEAEGIRYGSIHISNDPPGTYAGMLDQLRRPLRPGVGRRSLRTRGEYQIMTGQEYRSKTYGHLLLYLLDDILYPGQSYNADNWPLYGDIGRGAREFGGYAFYAHGGYAQGIYADFAQRNVNGVELLQFATYRGIGLTDWYHILNIGYRFPCIGGCDYPFSRKLGESMTYVELGDDRSFEAWLNAMADGRSFVTTAPMMLLEVDGQRPGSIFAKSGPAQVTARLRVQSLVAPVTNVQLIVNGTIAQELHVPASAGEGHPLELEAPVEVSESSWIAARAYATSPAGAADSDAHTNPVYVYLDGKAPYNRHSLDTLVGEIDKQIQRHSNRQFDEQAQVLAYFQRSRDILLRIRENKGLKADENPNELVRSKAKPAVRGEVQ
jgi:hypothetical protein